MKGQFKQKYAAFVDKHEGLKKFNGKISDFFKKYPSIRELILFTLFSFICFAIEYISYTIFALCIPNKNAFSWFIFSYDEAAGGVAAFVGFLLSNVFAQAATFLLNRKATFKATNNVVWAASMYAVMVCGIIILNTWLGGVVSSACTKSIASYSDMAYDNIVTLCGYIGKLVGSFTSFVISFTMSKFVIMRSPKKKNAEQAPEAVAEEISVNADGDDTAAE